MLSSHYILWWRLGTLHPIPSLQNPTSGSNSTASGWLSVSFQTFIVFFSSCRRIGFEPRLSVSLRLRLPLQRCRAAWYSGSVGGRGSFNIPARGAGCSVFQVCASARSPSLPTTVQLWDAQYSWGVLQVLKGCHGALGCLPGWESVSIHICLSSEGRGVRPPAPFAALTGFENRNESDGQKENSNGEERKREVGEEEKGEMWNGSSLENEPFEPLTWVLCRSRSLGLN